MTSSSAILTGLIGCVAGVFVLMLIIRAMRRRTQTEQRLSAQKQQLDVALAHMSQGLCMYDAAGKLVVANRRYTEMYGFLEDPPREGMSARDMAERKFRHGILAGDPTRYVDDMLVAGQAGRPRDQVVRTSTGRAIRVIQTPIAAGGWVMTHEDVTELRQAEEERDRQRKFLDTVIANVPSCIAVKDYAERRFRLINKSVEKLYDVTAAQVIGKTSHELFDRETADAIDARDEQSLRIGGEMFLHEDAVTLPSGKVRYLTSKRTCIRDADGSPQYLLNVIEDVTERRLVQDQLQQAQRMEAVGQLTGGLAHDFNNLLHIIIGNLDLLALEVRDNSSAAEKVEAILGSSLRGAELTAQLLAFSRRQSLAPRPLRLNRLLQHVIKLLNRTLGERILVEFKPDRLLADIVADEAQLEAALVNIAINARDAMPNGGKLVVATRSVVLDQAYCDKHAEVIPGHYAAIEITDTGVGMGPEVLSRIFEPFYTTKEPGRGTGLGLSMVFGFARQSGGHITAESEVGVGTIFRLYLPQAALPLDSKAGAVDAEGSAVTGENETILVVEDNPTIRSLVTTQLRALSYRVVEAEDAAAALRTLKQYEVDLLFTDVVMPGEMNGKQLATAARVRNPNLKVLFTSGFAGSGGFGDGADLEAGDLLLQKPYRRAELAKAVHDLLGPGPSP